MDSFSSRRWTKLLWCIPSPCAWIHSPVVLYFSSFKIGLPNNNHYGLAESILTSLPNWCVFSNDAVPKEDSCTKHSGFMTEAKKGWAQVGKREGIPSRINICHSSGQQLWEWSWQDEAESGRGIMKCCSRKRVSFVCFANLYKPVQNTTFERSRKYSCCSSFHHVADIMTSIKSLSTHGCLSS